MNKFYYICKDIESCNQDNIRNLFLLSRSDIDYTCISKNETIMYTVYNLIKEAVNENYQQISIFFELNIDVLHKFDLNIDQPILRIYSINKDGLISAGIIISYHYYLDLLEHLTKQIRKKSNIESFQKIIPKHLQNKIEYINCIKVINTNNQKYIQKNYIKNGIDKCPLFKGLPLVTVIICAYNAEKTINSAINSIQNQTYPFIEIIVVDDYSQDKTSKIIQRLANLDPRIILIKNTENNGCYVSRNNALKISKGKFITFHDADDYSLSTRIQTQLDALLRYNVLFTTCLIIRSHLPNFDFLNENSADDHELLSRVESVRTHKLWNNKYKYCCREILGMVTPLFRREIFEKIGLYWELRCIADAEYCERILYNYCNPQIFFQENESVVTFLSQKQYLPKIYYKIDQVLYISKEIDSTNITSKYRDKENYRKQLRNNWRSKLKGNFDYDYKFL